MLLFNNTISFYDPLNVVFLCGNKYARTDPCEKRNILKEYLETSIKNCRVVILEENFIFGRTNMQYLSYDDIFLDDLAQVEQLASLYADKIVIIHETISTAAELGMFAINPQLSKKICLITPDDIPIEERKVSGFIKLAFMNKKSKNTKIGEQIVYYPDIEVVRSSEDKSEYFTFFHENKIGNNLGNKLVSFISQRSVCKHLEIKKSSFGKATNDPNVINYSVDNLNFTVNVYTHINMLKIQLLALFFIEEYRKELRQTKAIKDHVSFISKKYEAILLNTIAEFEGLDFKKYKIQTMLKGTEICKLRQAIGYFLYLLQAIGLVGLEQSGECDPNQRKIRISLELDACKKELSELVITKRETEFGRLKL